MSSSALEGTFGRVLSGVFGTSWRVAVAAAVRRLGTAPERGLVVDGRLGTVGPTGRTVGMTTALARSSVSDRNAVSASVTEPNSIRGSLGEIGSVLRL